MEELQNNELLFVTSFQNPCVLRDLNNLTIKDYKHYLEKSQYYIEIK